MAFTRQSTGSTTSFTRDGALTASLSQPPFQVFSVSTEKSSYSLGGHWSLEVNTSLDTLRYKHKSTEVFKLTSSGPEYSSIVFANKADLPADPIEGTVVNHSGALKIYL